MPVRLPRAPSCCICNLQSPNSCLLEFLRHPNLHGRTENCAYVKMRSASKCFYLAVFSLLGASHAHEVEHRSSHEAANACAVRPVHQRSQRASFNSNRQIDPGSIVSDACASYSTLDALNSDLQSSIEVITRTTDFFSYYRLNLYNKVCPFWSDEEGLCGNIACAVNTIENEEDLPLSWRAEELGKLEGPKAHHPNKKEQQEARPLLGELGQDVGESCVVEYDDDCDERDYCIPEDESSAGKGDYVSLVDNPERYTGYSGPGAHQVWEAIYRENCFSKAASKSSTLGQPAGGFTGLQAKAVQDLRSIISDHGRQQHMATGEEGSLEDGLELEDECLEKRVFYRVISGMHASISTHLCWDYLNQTTGNWGPNVECYKSRLHGYTERISNLYFNYALVLRAVAKVGSSLQDYTFCSGDVAQDRATKQKVLDLAGKISSGPSIYDESLMFKDPDFEDLKGDFRNRFRNVSRIMDCVGCDKCRLWGKVQTSGYGTALKVLFEFDHENPSQNPPLRRTELVALFNTLDKLSHSLSAIVKFEAMLHPDVERSMHSKRTERTSQAKKDEFVEDDGHPFKARVIEESFMDIFWQEWSLIWRTTKWVLRQWAALPGNL